jgi:hypothetical protein
MNMIHPEHSMTHPDIRRLTERYFRHLAAAAPAHVDTWRLARDLERRLPATDRGPAARAMLQNLVSETAARHSIPAKW